MLTNYFKIASLVGLAVLQLGCADTYRPQTTSTARVRTKGDRKGIFHWNHLELMAIEGKPTGMLIYDGQYYPVDAGKRSFVVRYQGNRHYGGPFLAAPPIPVFGDLKPQRDYEITGKFTETAVAVYMQEVGTTTPVGPTTIAQLRYQDIQTGPIVPIFVPPPR